MTEEKVLTFDDISEGVSKEQAAELVEIVKAMEKNFAWVYVCKMLFGQAERRTLELLSSRFTNQADVYKNEFLKGEISGLQLAARAPQLLREHLEMTIQADALRRGSVDSSQDEAGK